MSIESRGARGLGYVLLTPDNRYPSRLPWLPEAVVYKLVSPRLQPAEFSEQILCLDSSPALPMPFPDHCEQFLYLLSGRTSLGTDEGELELEAGSYLYAPPGSKIDLLEAAELEMLRLHRIWAPSPDGRRPPAFHDRRDKREAAATDVPGLTRRELLPAGDSRFDFAISVMSFAAGVGLPQIEIHDEEHGLYMLDGDGRYLLGDDWHQVRRDDFIYMAPYCPQGFVAGPGGGEYLLYKNTFRDLP